MPHFYIHIGFAKTGTTSIQHFMAINREKLASNGVYYPYGVIVPECHHHLITERGRLLDKKEVQSRWEALVEESKVGGCEKVVLSSEGLALTLPDGTQVGRERIQIIADALAGNPVTVICYARRHDSAMQSAYNQWLKSGVSKCSPAEFVEKYNVSYLAILNNWAEAFGDENVRVFPFEKSELQPTLVDHFLKNIGEDREPSYVVPGRKNISPGGKCLGS